MLYLERTLSEVMNYAEQSVLLQCLYSKTEKHLPSPFELRFVFGDFVTFEL